MRSRARFRLIRVVAVAVVALSTAGVTTAASAPAESQAPEFQTAANQGYWLAGVDGSVFGFGEAGKFGSVSGGIPAVAGVAATPSGKGYWVVSTDGQLFAFGDAPNLGSTSGVRLNRPIVGLAPTPTGQGYWFVAADGGVFSFGDAAFFGSTGNIRLNRPIVGMASSPSGQGYWFVAADGGVFAYGDAAFFGSTGNIRLNRPIVGMASSPSGKGYWFTASDGGVFSFGDAGFYGSTGDMRLNQPIVGMAASPSGRGYWFVAADGGVFNFGDASFYGSTGGQALARPIAAMAAVPFEAPGPDRAPNSGPAEPTRPGPPTPSNTAPPTTQPPTPASTAPVAVPGPVTPFEIGLIGDTNYTDSQERSLLKVRDDMAKFPLAFVTHDGDIWNEGHSCADAEYLSVLGTFDSFSAPFIYTPGDNEWTDCANSSARLGFIRRTFFATNETLGRRHLTVTRQAGFPENARWTYNNVVFATMNQPGSDGRGGSHTTAQVDWLNAAFDEAQATGAAAVMVIWQDNPFEPSGGRLAKALKARTLKFARPVVLVHGDTHNMKIDHPWGDAANFTRVETYGDTSSASWIRAIVDPNSPSVFMFEREKGSS